VPFPPCPFLPEPRAGIDWRLLHAHRAAERREDFYRDCLEYGQALWRQGRAARAILCLDRAMGAELAGTEPVLAEWPMPYGAMVWILGHTPAGVFLGNPRVHFQHYAGRMNEPRREQRRWRAWACWALVRAVLPALPGDPGHEVTEPTPGEIFSHLQSLGGPGEADQWRNILRAEE